ncbi:hypothetical protein APICC_02446 [Apis cerana cerana]|uniref:Uncharacterized protein n=1 Tax=Apis cerana cerana TaxID=94128 RepID=A0A2A3EIP8_APICC|nr:hypothetical protein APICC_02446 [Apis cerana cerana]
MPSEYAISAAISAREERVKQETDATGNHHSNRQTLVILVYTGPICAANVRVHRKVHIPKFRGYDTRISWPARTPAGPTSCPASTAATKTKNRNWNQ